MKYLNTETNRRSMNLDFGSIVRHGLDRGTIREPRDAAVLLINHCNRLLDTGEVSRDLCDAALAEVRLNEAERMRLGLHLN